MEKDAFFYYNEGRNFYAMARNCFQNNNRKFNNELLFNILSISMERMLVSIILYHGKMPLSETVSGLLRETKDYVSWPDECIAQARSLNRFVHLCSLEPVPLKIPDNSELENIVTLASTIKQNAEGLFSQVEVS